MYSSISLACQNWQTAGLPVATKACPTSALLQGDEALSGTQCDEALLGTKISNCWVQRAATVGYKEQQVLGTKSSKCWVQRAASVTTVASLTKCFVAVHSVTNDVQRQHNFLLGALQPNNSVNRNISSVRKKRKVYAVQQS